MTTARLARGDLEGLDALQVDALALPMYAVRAQPRATAGFADWRLAGRIGRLVHSGRFAGAAGEALLMPGLGRLGAERVFLLGLGPPDEAASKSFADLVRVLAEAGARRLACAMPVTAEHEADVERRGSLAAALLKEIGHRKSAFDEVQVLDPDGGLEAVGDQLARAAKAAGLIWGG